MSTKPPRHRTLFSIPRDYFHRRRFRRRLTNIILIPLLSVVVAYIITRPTGGAGFTLPKTAHAASLSAPMKQVPAVPETAAHSASSLATGGFAGPDATPPASPLLSGAYMLAEGPHSVSEVADLVLHDAKRNEDLHVRVFYPNRPGPYPVIVFSSGAGDLQTCCDALTRHWASYGYVTLQPAYKDFAGPRGKKGEEDGNSLKALREALREPALWQSRAQDISFILDSVTGLPDRIPALAGKIDAGHIGVGGDSLGAFTADAIAGALVDLPGSPASSFADPRAKAVLLLSPQGPGEFGLTSHSWDHVTLPLLSMTGSLDFGADKQSPEWREMPFKSSKAGDKYHVFIQGADHTSFITAKTLMAWGAARGESILGYANSAALAFWDAYLKADPQAKIYLQSGALPDFSRGAVKLFRR
jgi:predicted dienelactone hydrolase